MLIANVLWLYYNLLTSIIRRANKKSRPKKDGQQMETATVKPQCKRQRNYTKKK